MDRFHDVDLYDLEVVFGGDGYGSLLHPNTWLAILEHNLRNPGKGGKTPTCEYYTPAYPGKVLPPC